MLYHLTLQTAGIVVGIFLTLVSLLAIFLPSKTRELAQRLPRARVAGIVILTIDLIWSFWLVATMEMGEFSVFRRPFLIALPIAYFLTLRFVEEFLAVRALGILALLCAEPLLEAAFFRYELSRLFVTVFAYALIIRGLLWVTMPYLMRDQINWVGRTLARWRTAHTVSLIYGAIVLWMAAFRY